jgi:flagellar FliL protein
MATSAPKAVPKAVAPTPATEQLPVKKSKKKLFLILGVAVLLGAGAGGAAWYFMGHEAASGDAAKEVKHEPVKPPVFIALEPFTVNLARESGEQFLQAALTLQVADPAQVDQIKLYMPLVRNRLLLLLSSKKASEISTVEGKKALSDEIIAQLKMPFAAHGEPQQVSGVFFTSFVIQ